VVEIDPGTNGAEVQGESTDKKVRTSLKVEVAQASIILAFREKVKTVVHFFEKIEILVLEINKLTCPFLLVE
jgi:hypothetical protein